MRDKRTRGFTLVELVIVIVIIGLLASIAIPKFSSSKERAVLTAMKADLRNLATQEESYFIDNSAYTTSFPVGQFRVTTGVTGPNITLTTDGWTASVGHNTSTRTCAIFMGTTSQPPAAVENVPQCSP